MKNCWEKLKFWRKNERRTTSNDETRFIELTPSEIAAEEANEKKNLRDQVPEKRYLTLLAF